MQNRSPSPNSKKPIAHPQAKTGSTTFQSKGNTAEMIAAAIERPMTAIALPPIPKAQSHRKPIGFDGLKNIGKTIANRS
jgi:hypothetical protein